MPVPAIDPQAFEEAFHKWAEKQNKAIVPIEDMVKKELINPALEIEMNEDNLFFIDEPPIKQEKLVIKEANQPIFINNGAPLFFNAPLNYAFTSSSCEVNPSIAKEEELEEGVVRIDIDKAATELTKSEFKAHGWKEDEELFNETYDKYHNILFNSKL